MIRSATGVAAEKVTVAVSVARLTEAATPSSLFSWRSTRVAHDAQVMPSIERSTVVARMAQIYPSGV